MARRLTARIAALAIAASAATALAAPFADPTRPPSLDGERAEAPAGPRLESILIAPDRRIAVVDGQQVSIGSRVGDGEVVGISESEVRLRKPGGEQSLKLFTTQARRAPAPGKGK
jgi:MSHA biogenesis protein MshK